MKKLMILGTDLSRIPLMAQTARSMGYYTILCTRAQTDIDVDKLIITDTNNIPDLYRIAVTERIDGIITGMDSHIRQVNQLASMLNLPGNAVDGINILFSKDRFRSAQRQLGVFAPETHITENLDEFKTVIKGMNFPIIMKPSQGNSSMGVIKIFNPDDVNIDELYDCCSESSKNRKVLAEEFVESDEPLRVIEAEIFADEDNYIWTGVRYCYRRPSLPFVPAIDVYDVELSDLQYNRMKDVVERILRHCGFIFGECDMEGFFTKNGEFFISEINPRQAGCYNPDFIRRQCGIDLTKLLVSLAVGDRSYADELKNFTSYNKPAMSVISFTDKVGIFDSIYVSEEIKPYVKFEKTFAAKGEKLRVADNANDQLGSAYLEFDTFDELRHYFKEIDRHIYPVVDPL